MRLLSILIIVLLCGSVALSSCSDSADTTSSIKKDSTTNTDSTNNLGSASDSSYGTANVIIDQSTKFTTTDNFFCYDNRDSTLRLQIHGDFYRFYFVLPIPGLHMGTIVYHNGYNVGRIAFLGMHNGSSAPIPYTATIKLIIYKLDLQTKQFSALISAHFETPFAAFDSVSSIDIQNAGIVIYPNGLKPSVKATVAGENFSVTGESNIKAVWNTSFTEEWQIDAIAGILPNRKSLTITAFPAPLQLGSHTVPLSGNIYYYDGDSSYSGSEGSVVVTSYDANRHMASGTFTGTLVNSLSTTTLSVTGGEFKNIFLDPD